MGPGGKNAPSYLLSSEHPQTYFWDNYLVLRVRAVEGPSDQIWEALGKKQEWKVTLYQLRSRDSIPL